MAVTVTVAEIEGIWNVPFADTIIYTRVWRDDGAGVWRVIAGQATRTQA